MRQEKWRQLMRKRWSRTGREASAGARKRKRVERGTMANGKGKKKRFSGSEERRIDDSNDNGKERHRR